jgi:hypothetical protein
MTRWVDSTWNLVRAMFSSTDLLILLVFCLTPECVARKL